MKRCKEMSLRSVVEKRGGCCGEVLRRSVVEKWCREVMWRSVVEKWCREVLWRVVEKCWREVL